MKTSSPQPRPTGPHAFSLIEMIGVLAIIAIMAATITPNALHMIERAAVHSEADTLRSLGEQSKLFLKANGWAPGMKPGASPPTWYQDLGAFADINPEDIRINKRQTQRLYVSDPVASTQQVLIISNMRRPDVLLPSTTQISNYFKNIWDTPEGKVPGTQPGLPAQGWGSWNDDNVEYLVIERVNLTSVSKVDLQSEAEILRVFGEMAQLYLRDKGAEPTTSDWKTILAPYLSLSPAELLTNRRQMMRLYVPDPVTGNLRAMFLSSMRNGLALPSAATLSANFSTIWNTEAGSVPAGPGWGAWNATNIEFLVIERVNLTGISKTDLQSEAEILHAMGEQTLLYTSEYGVPPTTTAPPTLPNWTTQLGASSSFSSAALLTNRRKMARLYVYEATTQRVMFLSSMRTGLALPSAAVVTANFSNIWNTARGNVPSSAGWNAWNLNNIEFLFIERVNLFPAWKIDLQYETDLLRSLGEQAKLYLASSGSALPATNWNTLLAPYVSLSPVDLLTNKRQMARIYVTDTSNKRAMLLSSMRAGVPLPSAATITANFANIWNTPKGSVPSGPGWGAWNTSNIAFLVIERVNERVSLSAAAFQAGVSAQSEADTLRTMGKQVMLYLRYNGSPPTTIVPPTIPNWTTQLATYSSLNTSALLTNSSQMTRVYVYDAANQRAMFLSSMQPSLALPTTANISANFTAIWNTPEGTVPTTVGWNAWNTSNISFLFIERVNFQFVYSTEFLPLVLKNTSTSAVTVSYKLVHSNGTFVGPINIPAGTSLALLGPTPPVGHPNDVLYLYRSGGGVNLDSTYILSTVGGNFEFNNATWTRTP